MDCIQLKRYLDWSSLVVKEIITTINALGQGPWTQISTLGTHEIIGARLVYF